MHTILSQTDSDEDDIGIELQAVNGKDSINGETLPTTNNHARVIINIIISFVGAGLLGIPKAFAQSGWLLGIVAVCIVSSLNVYAMLLLPQIRTAVAAQRQSSNIRHLAYGDLARILLGPRGGMVVNACLTLSQVGFATAYIIFIADVVSTAFSIHRWTVCLTCTIGLGLLVQATTLTTLAPFSLIANLSTATALSAVLWTDVERLEEQGAGSGVHAMDWSGLIYIMAITLYSMEGIGLVLSLEASVQPDKSAFSSLLAGTVGCITLFMCLFGVVSYDTFGASTQAPVTVHLQGTAAAIVQGALCVSLYLTYPIMMFPVWTILEGDNEPHRLQRLAVVLATVVVAAAVPDFGDFLSLVGSSVCTFLGFVVPCWMYAAISTERQWPHRFLWIGAVVLGGIGTVQAIQRLLSGEGGE